MSGIEIMGIVLIVAGIVGLLYGNFSYTKETHDIKLGPLERRLRKRDGQRPGMGRCGGNREWWSAPASRDQEELVQKILDSPTQWMPWNHQVTWPARLHEPIDRPPVHEPR